VAFDLHLRLHMAKRARQNAPDDILAVLKEQHEHVDELLEKLESGKGDRKKLFATLADTLAAHAGAEEKVFYPGVMREETAELLHESVEEHLSVKRLIADMLDLDPAEHQDQFDAKLSVLKEQVSHHAHKEEEARLFPLIRKLLSKEERADLANRYLEMFEGLLAQEPRREVPSQTREAAPLPPPA
jgi:hemerythrin superfamily protein